MSEENFIKWRSNKKGRSNQSNSKNKKPKDLKSFHACNEGNHDLFSCNLCKIYIICKKCSMVDHLTKVSKNKDKNINVNYTKVK